VDFLRKYLFCLLFDVLGVLFGIVIAALDLWKSTAWNYQHARVNRAGDCAADEHTFVR